MENLENAKNLKETKTKKAKSIKPNKNEVKFYISIELRNKLKKLFKSHHSESIVYKITEDLLNTQVVNKDNINYIGLSSEDYRKVSYITPDRIEKTKDSFFETRAITPNSSIVLTIEKPLPYYNPEKPRFRTGFHQEVYKIPRSSLKKLNREKAKLFLIREKVLSHNEDLILPDGSIVSKPVYIDNFKNPWVQLSINEHYEYNYDKVLPKNHPDPGVLIHDTFFIDLEIKKYSSVWDPRLRYHASIHKVIEKLFPQRYTEYEKTQFLESFLKVMFTGKNNCEFKLVSGDAINHYYHQDSYLQPENSSTLWKSCMRYPTCQDYFSIYTNNPDFVQLAVLLDKGKVVARALVWFYEGRYYYDRIYYYDNEYEFELENNFITRNYINLRDENGNAEHEISFYISEHKFNSYRLYPYMDTVKNYFPDANMLSTADDFPGRQIQLQETEGQLEEDTVDCEICGTDINREDALTIDYGRHNNSTVCGDCGVYCTHDDLVIYRRDSVYSEIEHSYIHEEDAIELFNGNYCHKDNDYLECYENDYGYFLSNCHNYNEIDFRYYHPDDPEYYRFTAEQEEEEEEDQEIRENQENQENQEIKEINHERI